MLDILLIRFTDKQDEQFLSFFNHPECEYKKLIDEIVTRNLTKISILLKQLFIKAILGWKIYIRLLNHHENGDFKQILRMQFINLYVK